MNRKKYSLIFFSLCLYLISSLSFAEGFVWKVESKDSKNTLYLGGTIHVLAKSDYPLPAAFDKAYSLSDTLVFETDLSQQETQAFQQAMVQRLFYRDGQRLDQVIGKKAWAEFEQWCAKNNIPAEQFLAMKPGLAAITVSMTELMKLGITQEGVDSFYFKKGQRDGKPFNGLETTQEQLGFLADMGGKHPDKLILQTLAEVDEIPTLFPKVKTVWRAGDAQALNQLMVKDMKDEYPEVYQSLLIDRNQAWMPKIEKAINNKGTEFILVGAAHLVGDEGLLSLLERKGYRLVKI